MLSLQDFLEHNGVGHCFTNLNARRIFSVSTLSQFTYTDLCSFGLREEDAYRISDALRLQGYFHASTSEGSRTQPRFQRPPPLPPQSCFPPVTLRRQQAMGSLPPTPGGLAVASGSSVGVGTELDLKAV